MWDPPRPGIKTVSPALAGGFPTTAPPGKSWLRVLNSKSELSLGVRDALILWMLKVAIASYRYDYGRNWEE